MRLVSGWRLALGARAFGVIVCAAAVVAVFASACGGSGSPSNKNLVVYEAAAPDHTSNVWTIDPNTGASKELTFGTSFDGNPAWSPDRKQIIFTSDRDREAGKSDVYIMDANGKNVRRITQTPASEVSPKFSLDGKQIAYAEMTDNGAFLDVMDASGANTQRLAGPYKFVEFPAWRPDTQQIYFAAIALDRDDIDIYSVDVSTKQVRPRISTPASDACPHFTHDGKTLTYASVAKGEEAADNEDLFAHDLTSTDERTDPDDKRLTADPAVDDYANPSPDDKSIVFISHRDGNAELYVMDRDGSNQRRLTNTPDINENVPDW